MVVTVTDQFSESESMELCLKLLAVDTEEGVTRILDEKGLLNSNDWHPLGETEGNWSIVGNQQSSPVSALADKIVNSIDAVLVAECWGQGMSPESLSAPQTMEEAVERFFGIQGGRLANATPEQRRKMADRIFLIATGARPEEARDPSYTIVDTGEGQTPSRVRKTLLSLPTHGKPSKSGVKFVQGIYNMGGTGVLPFCGSHNYELIISKRCPSSNSDPSDPSSTKWSFTLVRRLRPTEPGARISVYQYLAPAGSIMTISAETLPLLPGNYPSAYSEPVRFGTCIKLYEYTLKPDRLRGPAVLDLNYELSRYFQSVAIPLRICERRPGYEGHSFDATMAGMSVRLEDDRSKVLEDGFPTGGSMPVPGLGDLPVTIYAFRREIERGRWMSDKSIVFVLNGQMHAYYRWEFFSRQRVDLGYLERDLLVVVDFSGVPPYKREDLLMPSRDRLREGPDRDAAERALEDFLKDHEGLRELNEKRRQEELQSVFGQDKPLEKILGKLLKQSPSLATLFGFGQKLTKPTGFEWRRRAGDYGGKPFPTFFRLAPDDPSTKRCPLNSSCKFRLETDATNDYFVRSRKPGVFVMAPQEAKKSLRLWNGIADLVVKPLSGAAAGTTIPITVQVTDPQRTEPFPQITLEVVTDPPISPRKANGQRRDGIRSEEKDARFKLLKQGEDVDKGLDLPKITPLWKEDHRWKDHFSDESDAVDPKRDGSKIDIFVNMNNPFLQAEIQSSKPGEKFVLENQFKYGLALVSLAIHHDHSQVLQKNGKSAELTNGLGNETDVFGEIRRATRGVAMVILPVANNLGSITKSITST